MNQRHVMVLLLAGVLAGGGPAQEALAQKASTPPSSLMGRIRTFLGIQPRSVSVGGTRSASALAVCLLSPAPAVQLLDPQPPLVLGSPLNELELRRGETVLWSKLASSTTPISGRLAWPLPPLQPGERLELAMRPQGASGGDWAVVQLVAGSAEDQQRYAAALQASASDAKQRLQQLDQAAAAGDGALVQALLWAPLNPSSSALAALQREQQASCQTTPNNR